MRIKKNGEQLNEVSKREEGEKFEKRIPRWDVDLINKEKENEEESEANDDNEMRE